MRASRESGPAAGVLGIVLLIVIALGVLWIILGDRTAPTISPGTGIDLQPPPTTPITPRSSK